MNTAATLPVTGAASKLIAQLTARAATGIRIDHGLWGELVEVYVDGHGPEHGTLEIADRDFSARHHENEHTGWSIFARDENGDLCGGPIYISGDGETPVNCYIDSVDAAEAAAEYIAARAPKPRTMYGPLRYPDHVRHDCTGPNRNCRKAGRQGHTVHIIPSEFVDGSHLMLPTYHYETEERARAAVETARRDAVVIRSDAALYRARRHRQAYRLLPGWTDPTRRYGTGF
ncbi:MULTISPECIES: hypothetical protein [unclassified Streptomyces]|uniref:hypothetical protein n=1 Tax=unclassified Streptomyces TaxID=2593676 RepID=UPI00331F59F0